MGHSRVSINEKRNRLELYYSILCAIHDEQENNKNVKPTRVQFLAGTSYDKVTNYLEELKEKNIKLDPIKIAKKGEKFIQEYHKINDMVEKLGLKFMRED